MMELERMETELNGAPLNAAGTIELDGKRFLREPEDVYHALSKSGQTVSSHMLAVFRDSPVLYHKMISGEVAFPESDAFRFGRAAHKYLLEGSAAFERDFMVADGPINPKTMQPYGASTKAYSEWAAKLEKPVIASSELELIRKMYSAICANEHAVELLESGVAEAVIRETVCGVPCQIRMDWVNPIFGIVDLKTCDSLKEFERDARKYGYLAQMAFYRMVYEFSALEGASCYLIAVEKREPYSCGVWRCDADALDEEEERIKINLRRLAECRKSGVWPTGYELVRILRSTYR